MKMQVQDQLLESVVVVVVKLNQGGLHFMNKVRIIYEWDFETNTSDNSDSFIITSGSGIYKLTEDKK